MTGIEKLTEFQSDWNKWIRDVLGVRLDREQRKLIRSIQDNRKTSVRSGHARGKDFTAAVASICFLYLHHPCEVINTAPTYRQVQHIMMAEIKNIISKARIPLGGWMTENMIKFQNPKKFLLGFKSDDQNVERWTGFHSPNIMVVVTEASGLSDTTFNAIEGVLTGENPKLLLIFNPNRLNGFAYQSTKDPTFSKFKLSSMSAPNVRAGKTVIPGQIDREWVLDKLKWCQKITPEQYNPIDHYDFKFSGGLYRPNDLFRVKVLGEFPAEGENKLIPTAWIEAAVERWHEIKEFERTGLKLGADVAGMGRDDTVLTYRYKNYVEKITPIAEKNHMALAGIITDIIRNGPMHVKGFNLKKDMTAAAYIDAIGEGAGVYSRVIENDIMAAAVKGSENAKGLTDLTGEREFFNMRAYLHWALRDALDPSNPDPLAIPPDDYLIQELNEPTWEMKSNGKIIIEEKDEIKKRIGRSPDRMDSLLNTFYPHEPAGSGFFVGITVR